MDHDSITEIKMEILRNYIKTDNNGSFIILQTIMLR